MEELITIIVLLFLTFKELIIVVNKRVLYQFLSDVFTRTYSLMILHARSDISPRKVVVQFKF